MKFVFSIYLFSVALVLQAQKFVPFEIMYGNDYVEVKASQNWLKGAQSFNLYIGGAAYLTCIGIDKEQRVFDSIDGISFEFKALDVDGDGKTELLVFYHFGTNVYALKIYEICETADDEGRFIVAWKNQPSVSHQYRRIDIEKGKIIVYSKDYSLSGDDDRILRTEYEVNSKALKIVSDKHVKSLPAK